MMIALARFASRNRRRQIAARFSAKLQEILRSQLFDGGELNDVGGHRVTLSQACMLLWRDWFTGDVDGLWIHSPRLAAAYACLLVELYTLGKISFEFPTSSGDKKVRIKILDRSSTNSYLDQAAFAHLLCVEKMCGDLTLEGCISRAIKWKLRSRKNCASCVLNSFEDLKVLKMKRKYLGFHRKYKTLDLEPYALLEKEIRLIVLRDKAPDCYMRTLLTLLNVADSFVNKRGKLLKRYFTKNEYLPAVERLKMLSCDWTDQPKEEKDNDVTS